MEMRGQDRLIVALDVGSYQSAMEIVDQLEGTVNFFKVGLQLFIATGLAVVRGLVDREKRVFLDIKMNDVTETIRRSVAEATALGVEFLTIHGNGATAEAARKGRQEAENRSGTESKLQILSLTLLTSLDEQDLRDLYLVGTPNSRFSTLEEYVSWRSEQAIDHGCDGLITSGQNVAMLRKKFPNALLVCPGIRPTGDAKNDHKRTSTPYQTIKDGADYLVVGRPIRNADNPVKKAQEIISDIDEAWAERAVPV